MKTSYIVFILVAIVSIPATGFDEKESSEALDLYMRAQRAYLDLKKDESQFRNEDSWRSIINSYQVIIDSYPNDRLVDDITFLQGDIYRKMYEIFGERRYLDLAVSSYRTILRDYPNSFLQQASLFALAEVQELHMKMPYQALDTYKQLLGKYPKGYRTAAARQRIDALYVELGIEEPQPREAEPRVVTTAAESTAEKAGGDGAGRITPAVNKRPVKAEAKESKLTAIAPARIHGTNTGTAVINDIRSSFGAKSGRVTIEVSREIQFKYESLPAPNRRIFFDLHNVDVSRSKLAAREISIDNKYLRGIRIAQFNRKIARVVLDFDAFTDFNVFTLPGPGNHFRIVFDLYNAGKGPSFVSAAADSPAGRTDKPAKKERTFSGEGASSNSDGKYTLSRQLGIKINRIIIDPGHGGKDPGASGYGGMTEKELNLDVAKRLKRVFARKMPEMEVLLTRETDGFVELDQRPAISKAKEGDLFISIHSNSTRKGRASGIETYYLNFASDKEAEQLAAKENALSRLNQAKLRDLIGKIAANNKKEESKELALFIQNNLYQQTRKVNGAARNRGVRSAPFVVLIGTNVPSVLVEIGFINHAVEGKLLSTPPYRDRIANGLFYGIKAYIDSMQ
jgi:N-acetylmuramoyl-L-alanine amidase